MNEENFLINEERELTGEMNDFLTCPNCNNHVEKTSKICGECGYKFKAKRKTIKLIISLISLCVFILVGVLIMINIIMPKINQNNMEKSAAQAIVALNEVGSLFNYETISNIYIADNEVSYEKWGEKTVFVRETIKGTDCIYCVCIGDPEALQDFVYTPKYKNEKYGYTIYAIGEDNYTKGWLKGGWDRVSDALVEHITENNLELNKDNVMKRVNNYLGISN